MYGNTVGNPPLSAPATARWKSIGVSSRRHTPSLANHRRLRKMIEDQDTSQFIESSIRAPLSNKNKWSRKDTEKQEVSTHLALLKKRFDRSRRSWSKQDKEMQGLDQALSQINFVEDVKMSKHRKLEDRLQEVEAKIEEVKKQQEDANFDRSVYLHMLERMKQIRIHLDIRANALQGSLKSKEFVLQTELMKKRKTKENKIQSKQAFRILKNMIDIETREKEDEISEIEKDISQRQIVAQRREERQRRQIEIAEAAANEDKDRRLTEMKDKMLLHRLYYQFLNDKQERERQTSRNIEEAFEKIRKLTGTQDIHDVVERFLTKEQTYAELMHTVKLSEKRLDSYKKDIKELERQIHGAEISDPNDKKKPIVKMLENQALEITKEFNEMKHRCSKLSIVYKRVADWGTKVLKKIQATNNQDMSLIIENIDTPYMSPNPSIENLKRFPISICQIFTQVSDELKNLLKPWNGTSHELRERIAERKQKKLSQLLEELPENFKIHNKRFKKIEEGEDIGIEHIVYLEDPKSIERKSTHKKLK
jgi:hypothetical protein